jgi:hypothetical protein
LGVLHLFLGVFHLVLGVAHLLSVNVSFIPWECLIHSRSEKAQNTLQASS